MKKINFLTLIAVSILLVVSCKKEVDANNTTVTTPMIEGENGTDSDSVNSVQKLTITVEGIKNVQGKMNFALYNSASTFNNPDQAFREYFIDVTQKPKQTFVFDDIPPGTYALALFHDENSNYELDQNFIGIPQEGFAFSNNAFGSFGPPSYSDARFDFPEGNNVNMTLTLRFF